MTLRALTTSMLVFALVFWGCSKSDNNNPNSQHSIHITSPNGGETWTINTSHSIMWTSTNVSTVTIQFSPDGGTNWTALATAIANTNAYSWLVPNTPATTCKIKVSDANDAAASDVSDATFTVATASATDNASGQASSDSPNPVTIETPGGARLVIPPGAVPRFADGSSATQTFSIERTADAPPTPPTGETVAGPMYRFGPEGFTFAMPIEVTIPVTNPPDSTIVLLYRYNPTTAQLTRANATYDPTAHVIRAQTNEFSLWFPSWGEPAPTAAGCVHVTNASTNWWVYMCVDSVHLDYPEQATWLAGSSGGGLWAPSGHFSLASESNFHLPQGDYRMCVQWASVDSPFVFHHIFHNLSIHSPSEYWTGSVCAAEFTFTGPAAPSDTGRCVCSGTPSVPVHTGPVQVTLNWYVADEIGRDLDLHVVDPDSEEIYYAHTSSASGGQLDRDMICLSIHNMQENIYWTQNPPNGEYVVKVHFYGNCGTGDTTYTFNVRTVVLGQTHTFSGQVSLYQTVEITRFRVGSSAEVIYDPAPPHVVPCSVALPRKDDEFRSAR